MRNALGKGWDRDPLRRSKPLGQWTNDRADTKRRHDEDVDEDEDER